MPVYLQLPLRDGATTKGFRLRRSQYITAFLIPSVARRSCNKLAVTFTYSANGAVKTQSSGKERKMGTESSTSDALSRSSTGGKEEDVMRGGSLDGSREVNAGEKPGEGAKGDAEADQADVTRNGSLDNARG